MNFAQATSLFVGSDIVVLGSNPEMADYSNPRGHIHGIRAYVVAEAPDGSRWAHRHGFVSRWERDAIEQAEQFQQRVQARLDAGGALDEAQWTEMQPGYGSEAYVAGDWGREAALRERMDDEEEGWR